MVEKGAFFLHPDFEMWVAVWTGVIFVYGFSVFVVNPLPFMPLASLDQSGPGEGRGREGVRRDHRNIASFPHKGKTTRHGEPSASGKRWRGGGGEATALPPMVGGTGVKRKARSCRRLGSLGASKRGAEHRVGLQIIRF